MQLTDDTRVQNVSDSLMKCSHISGRMSWHPFLCIALLKVAHEDPWASARAHFEYDMTLGYPGEGPRWALISANVDSLVTNDNCLHWEADVLALQEARVAKSNLVEVQRKAALCQYQLFCSQPLQKARASNGTYRVPS